MECVRLLWRLVFFFGLSFFCLKKIFFFCKWIFFSCFVVINNPCVSNNFSSVCAVRTIWENGASCFFVGLLNSSQDPSWNTTNHSSKNAYHHNKRKRVYFVKIQNLKYKVDLPGEFFIAFSIIHLHFSSFLWHSHHLPVSLFWCEQMKK